MMEASAEHVCAVLKVLREVVWLGRAAAFRVLSRAPTPRPH